MSHDDTKTAAAPSFPFPMPFATDAWQKAMRDGMERANAFWTEYAHLEQQGLTHARTVMGEGAKMATHSFEYAVHLGTEWRKLAMESTKRSMEMLGAR